MQGSEYTEEQRREAVVAYQVLGNGAEIERLYGIPRSTLCEWRQTEWWQEYTAQVSQEVKEQLTADLTRVYKKAVAELEDRLNNGDEVMTRDGPKRIKVRARDAAVSASILCEKRQLLLNQPTSIQAGNAREGLKQIALKLMQAFEASKQQHEKAIDGTAERVAGGDKHIPSLKRQKR